MSSTNTALTTKERIIKTTLDIISKEGFQNVTVRKIASQAGVNIAAVNYHFGSKDLVIDKALRYVTSELKKVFTILKNHELPVETRMQNFFQDYAETVYKYPDIMRHMIDQKIHNCDSHVEYSDFLEHEGIPLILDSFRELFPKEPQGMTPYLKTVQILSSISFPLLLGSAVEKIYGLDLLDGPTRSAFFDQLIDQVLHK